MVLEDFFVCVCGTQGLTLTKQVLYHLTTLPTLGFIVYSENYH
jgi:hypothetical protein